MATLYFLVVHSFFNLGVVHSVISGISRRVCAISGSRSRNRRSLRARTRGEKGDGRAFRVEQRTKFGSRGRNGRTSRASARAAEREGVPFAVNQWRGETCGVRVEALGARTDSDRPCKGSCGARKRPRGVARGGARTGCGRAAAGKRAFAINGRRREVGTRLPPRGRARADSGRRRMGVGGFGPNLSCIT